MSFGRRFRRQIGLPTRGGRAIDRDLDDEVSFHIEMRMQDLMRAGTTEADARRQALARVQVLTRPDGSRHAVLGGLIRAYTVVHVGADGWLTEECVSSEEQARARVQAHSSSAKRGN